MVLSIIPLEDVVANYISNGFNVAMPELSGSGKVDIYAEKDGIKI